MTKDLQRFTFRLPKALLDNVKEEAKIIGISANALILQILWEWANNEKR